MSAKEIANLVQKMQQKFGVKIENLASKNRTFSRHNVALRVAENERISESERSKINKELAKLDELA